MIRKEDVIKIGQLGKPHGVKGEINFTFTTDVWDRAEAEYLIVMVDGILVPFFLEEYRFRGEHTALLKFLDIDSIEAVQEYVGAEVYLENAQIERITSTGDGIGEVSWSYFEGFHVVDEQRGDLGEIVSVDDSTVNVLFELEDGTLLPAVEDFIRDIDHKGHVISMTLPDGLLEIENLRD